MLSDSSRTFVTEALKNNPQSQGQTKMIDDRGDHTHQNPIIGFITVSPFIMPHCGPSFLPLVRLDATPAHCALINIATLARPPPLEPLDYTVVEVQGDRR